MNRLPIRIRLSAVFALAIAAVLSAGGLFIHSRLGTSLTEQIDDALESRAEALAVLVRQDAASGDLTGAVESDEDSFAQVLGPGGALVATTPSVADRTILTPADLRRAREGILTFELSPAPVDGGAARVLAMGGKDTVVVVGLSVQDREDALAGLRSQLLIAGPVALILTVLAGYALSGAALRPVEAMRERAAAISSNTRGERLPLPAARDELSRLGETLNEMLGRLEAGLARERRFVADASHELRTPLALLQAELELALRRPRTADEAGAALRSAAEEVDRLTRLAEDLLVLARSDEGELPLNRTEIDVPGLLESVARRFEARARDLGRTVVVEAEPEAVVVADRLRLEQALGNLVENALRHGTGDVRVGATRDDGGMTFTVTDAGGGFPEAFLPHAFERFSRADASRSGSAAGLGLTIVDAIARAHGGRAVVANRAGGGAEISLMLPVRGLSE